MKRKICSLLAACLLLSAITVPAFGATSDITINVNGILQPVKTGIINKNGNNLVGIREISEILGADDVYWNSNDRNVKIKKDGKTVALYVDSGKVTIDDEEIEAPVSAEIIDSSVFVPLRFVSEIFDLEVDWNSAKRVITITPPEKSKFVVLNISSDDNENVSAYTYDEALQSALDKNSELKNLDDTIEYLTESRSQMGNNIKLMDDAYASYTFLLNGANGAGISDSTALQASLVSTIDSTIKIMQGMKSADVNKSLKDVNEEMIKDGAAATLKNYLSSIKTSEMNIALMEENVKLGKENIQNLELKLSVGMESEQNVTTAKLDQKELESNLESAKISLDKLKESLKSFIGVDSSEDITVNYDISFDQIDDVQLESYITLKKQNDPSIKVLKAQVDIAEYNKKIAVNSRTDAERQELTNNVNAATRKLSDAQDSMETNIRNAYNSIRQLEEQNKAKKTAVSKAIETYNSTVVSYQAGMATIFQVNQAKLGILNAEIAVEQNAIDYDMLVFTFQRPYMLSGN